MAFSIASLVPRLSAARACYDPLCYNLDFDYGKKPHGREEKPKRFFSIIKIIITRGKGHLHLTYDIEAATGGEEWQRSGDVSPLAPAAMRRGATGVRRELPQPTRQRRTFNIRSASGGQLAAGNIILHLQLAHKCSSHFGIRNWNWFFT